MNAAPQAWRGPRGNKYGARRTTVDGLSFDSAAEAKRWSVLGLLQRSNHIQDVQRQVPFPLYVGDWLIGNYVADFVYHRQGKRVIEDVKGKATDLFNWKAKHFAAQYGQEIEVVR